MLYIKNIEAAICVTPLMVAKAEAAVAGFGLLSVDELVKCCDLYGIAGVPFLSLATGLVQDSVEKNRVELVRRHLSESTGIKVGGGANRAKDSSAAGARRVMLPFIR